MMQTLPVILNKFFLRIRNQTIYLEPRFQNESSSKTFHIKMSLICMKMNLKWKHSFISVVSQKTRYETEAKGNSQTAYC